MNPGDDPIHATLRRIAHSAPQGASAETGRALMREFRAHHARRRRGRLLRTVALGACAAAAIAFAAPIVNFVKRPAAPAASRTVGATVAAMESARVIPVAEEPAREPAPAAGATGRVARAASRTPASVPLSPAPLPGDAGPEAAGAGDFVLLPSFDPSLPAGPLQVVRLEMPGTDLNLIGIPVNESVSGLRVVADVMIGYDGRPYAVRLVRAVR